MISAANFLGNKIAGGCFFGGRVWSNLFIIELLIARSGTARIATGWKMVLAIILHELHIYFHAFA